MSNSISQLEQELKQDSDRESETIRYPFCLRCDEKLALLEKIASLELEVAKLRDQINLIYSHL